MAEYDGSMADVLKRALHDAQDLMRSEIALAKIEMREEVQRVGAGMMSLAAAAAAALMAGMILLMALAWGIAALFVWPVWAGFALVGVLVLVVAGVLAMVGRNRLTSRRPMPRTMDTMKENVEWMKARTS